MRKIIVLSFLSLDGVIQAPGGPEEDTDGDFKYGGWSFGPNDDLVGKEMVNQMSHDFDLLLGRRTYGIFASYWPFVDTNNNPIAAGINKARKYVVSKTLDDNFTWPKSFLIKDNVVEEIKKLKAAEGPEIQVHVSGNMIQTLLKNDLVDEFWLKIYPITLGTGKKLFADGSIAKSFELLECKTTPKGIILAKYKKDGDIKTGSFTEKK